MKRFTAITLVLMLLFVFTISAAAQDSPTPKQYYKIVATAEGSGTASASTNKVEAGTGETVVLTATPDKGYFTRWIIKGDYEILEGKTIEDEVITIRPGSDFEAIASFSVDADYLNMFVDVVTDGHDTASANPARVLKGSDTEVTFTAEEVDSEFIEWEFFCEYKIVRGDLKSKSITIIPYTDVTGVAHFKNGATPPNPDDSDTSPKTGESFPFAVIPFMALALGAAVVSTKKLKEN